MKVMIKKFPFLLESLFVSLVLLFVFWLLNGQQLYGFTNDSGAYLLNSIELKVPGDRTIFYSLLIWFLRESMGIHSLFPIIFLPLWMVVYGLSLVASYLFTAAQIKINRIALLILLAVGIWFSGAMWIFAQIMPDVFTGLLFLSWYLFTIKVKTKHAPGAVFWGLIMVVSSVMHNAHLLVILGFFLLNIMFNKKHLINSYLIKYKIFYFLPFVLVLGSNLIYGNGFTLSKNAPVFLVAKMSENGILKKYLDKTCEKENLLLCQFKDDLPVHAWDYIWPSEGIHMMVGGWYHTDSLYRKILLGIITDKYLCGELAIATFKATFNQLLLFGVGDGLIEVADNSTILNVLSDFYDYDKHSIESFSHIEVDFTELNYALRIIVIVLIGLCLLGLGITKSFNYHLNWFLCFWGMFIAFIFLQAFSTGAIANLLMRLNMRALWLVVPFSLILILTQIISFIQKRNC